MTHKAQIDAINAELAKIGYKAVKITKPRSSLARIKVWKPETAAGKKCKSAMLYWASLPPIGKPKLDVTQLLRAIGFHEFPCPHDLIWGGRNTPTGLWIETVAPRTQSNRMIEA